MAHRRSPQIVNFSVWGDFYFLHIPKARRITSREAAQPSQPSVHAETVILVDDGKSRPGLEFTWHPETRRRKPMMLWSLAGERSVRTWQIVPRSEEHTSELQSRGHLVCRLLLEKKKQGGTGRLRAEQRRC